MSTTKQPARACVACGEGHHRVARLCAECQSVAGLRNAARRIAELEREVARLTHELEAAQAAPRVVLEGSLWWYRERDLLSSGHATPLQRAEANRLTVEQYLANIYGASSNARSPVIVVSPEEAQNEQA